MSAPHFYYFESILQVHNILTILSHFYKCATFWPLCEILTSAPYFYHFEATFTIVPHLDHFEAFLRVHHICTINSHFYRGATFLLFSAVFTSDFEPILPIHDIFTILSQWQLRHILPISATLTSMLRFYHLEPFVRVWQDYFEAFFRMHRMFTILSHFYEGATFLTVWAIFTSRPHFDHFEPFLRVRYTLIILSHFCNCATFLPFWAKCATFLQCLVCDNFYHFEWF